MRQLDGEEWLEDSILYLFNVVECVGVIIFILYYFIHKFKDADMFNPRYELVVWGGTAVAQWLRRCATNRKVAGLIPDCVIGIFH